MAGLVDARTDAMYTLVAAVNYLLDDPSDSTADEFAHVALRALTRMYDAGFTDGVWEGRKLETDKRHHASSLHVTPEEEDDDE